MSHVSFEDRLDRIRTTAEQRETTPLSPSDQAARPAADTDQDKHSHYLEFALILLGIGLGGIYAFDSALALKAAVVVVPAMVILGIILLLRSTRNGAANSLDTGLELLDRAKSILNLFK